MSPNRLNFNFVAILSSGHYLLPKIIKCFLFYLVQCHSTKKSYYYADFVGFRLAGKNKPAFS